MNESLLQIPEVRSEVGRTLTNYFLENVDPLMSPMIVWEAHKCVLRGELIRIGALKKRKRTKQIDLLISKVRSLELLHKRSLAEDHLKALLKVRGELKDLLFQKTAQKLAWARRSLFEFSNKPGSMLARALRGPRKRTFIPYITTSQGTKVHTSKSIADEFYKYYRQLYNLHPKDSTEAMTDKTKSDIEYIRASGMPILSDEVRDSLESEITAEEFHEALAQTTEGPGA